MHIKKDDFFMTFLLIKSYLKNKYVGSKYARKSWCVSKIIFFFSVHLKKVYIKSFCFIYFKFGQKTSEIWPHEDLYLWYGSSDCRKARC